MRAAVTMSLMRRSSRSGVEAAELHRPADPHLGRRAGVQPTWTSASRIEWLRDDARLDEEAVALAGLHREADADQLRERRRPRAGGEQERVGGVVALRGADAVDGRAVGRPRTSVTSASSTISTPISRSFVGDSRREASRGARASAGGPGSRRRSRRRAPARSACSSAVIEDVVGQVVAVGAHRLQLRELLARGLRLARGDQHPHPVKLELDAVLAHLVDEVEDVVAERGERLDAVLVVAGVAVGHEAQQPRRQLAAASRALEVEGRAAVEQRADPVPGEARLGQRPGLRRAQPAAVAPGGAAADGVGLEDRHVHAVAGAGSRPMHSPATPPPMTTTLRGELTPAPPPSAAARPAGPRSAGRRRRAWCAPAAAAGTPSRTGRSTRRSRARSTSQHSTRSTCSGPEPAASRTASASCEDDLAAGRRSRRRAASPVAGSTAARPERKRRSPQRVASDING